MASSKTLMDLFQPAKRLKVSSSSDSSKALEVTTLSSLCKSATTKISGSTHVDSQSSSSSDLTLEQKSRIDFNKSLAKSKLNLRFCSERVSKSKAEGVGFVKLEELLVEETWSEALPGELQKPYAKTLCKFVEREICGGGVPIYPPQHLIFNALNSTPFDRVKAVIIGQDPYHGPGQAMGLSFSVPEGVKVPSSLVNIFKELQQDLGCSIPSHGNLGRWAVQGILLLNSVLTVRNHQANSHAKKGWEQFTDAVIRTVSQKKKGVVFLLWGNSAQEKSRLIDETKHHVLKAAHPSGLSANRGFFGCRACCESGYPSHKPAIVVRGSTVLEGPSSEDQAWVPQINTWLGPVSRFAAALEDTTVVVAVVEGSSLPLDSHALSLPSEEAALDATLANYVRAFFSHKPDFGENGDSSHRMATLI